MKWSNGVNWDCFEFQISQNVTKSMENFTHREQICQNHPYKHAHFSSILDSCMHRLTIQGVSPPIAYQSGFNMACFWGLSDIHKCLDDLNGYILLGQADKWLGITKTEATKFIIVTPMLVQLSTQLSLHNQKYNNLIAYTAWRLRRF